MKMRDNKLLIIYKEYRSLYYYFFREQSVKEFFVITK